VGSCEGLALWLCLGPVVVGLDAFFSFSLLGSPGFGLIVIWLLLVLSSLEENDQNFQQEQDGH
jgi:hypothetical protein